MYRISEPSRISVRHNGREVTTVKRLRFERGPEVVGWVNYRGKQHPIFKDEKGKLYLDQDGWVRLANRPLQRSAEDYKMWTAFGPRFRY
jgi:hypothetical protein